MDKSLEELSCKLKTLKFRMNKTNDVIDKRDKEALEWQRLSVVSSATVVNTIKETIEESMFAKGETEEKVKQWSQEVEVLLPEADQCTCLITNEEAAQESVMLKEQQQKLQFEKELTEQQLRQEQESVEEKRKLDLDHHERLKEAQQSSTPHETECKQPGMTANHVGRSKVVHLVVVVHINGYKFRALMDSSATALTTAIDLSGAKVKSTSFRQIAMLMVITTRTMQVYNIQVSSLANNFSLNVNLTKIENRELLSLENPHYSTLIQEYKHLKEVHIDDDDPKDLLPIHLIFGANDYAKIRTREKLLVGRMGEPVAEPTRFGWAMMSPGAEQETTVGCLAVNSTTDYDNLCSLDILGLADTLDHKEHFIDEYAFPNVTKISSC
ncbi:Hypothetical predicted protein [Paramuricea clavata]|uniref:Uncharacterized protein n=1 Tax=Paramuricea clavata TaxID=317549 RepID=A0A6S7GXL3_PARCT|nr:Hypothetical predicted protein [Paramuricea clavata]